MKRLVLLLPAVLLACSGEAASDLAIRTSMLQDGRLGENYEAKIEVIGGRAPYAFAVTDGALPEGITLRAATGQLVGVAGSPGRANPTFEVKDADGASASATLALYVVPRPLTIVTSRLAMAREGTALDVPLTANGGVAPYSWRIEEGALPSGVTIDDDRIAGTPREFGAFAFTLAVDDAEATSATKALELFVVSRAPMVTTSTVPKGRVGEDYEARIQATGGTPPYAFELASGALPMGLGVDIQGGLTGIPEEPGDFAFSVGIVDADLQRSEVALMMRVVAPLEILTVGLPQLVAGRTLDVTFEAAGGEPPYTWALEGALPTGVAFDPSGHLSGTSESSGTYALTARVTDADGFTRAALFSLRVADRYVFEVRPQVEFPPVCTGTTVSYTSVPIEVTESFAVADVDVSLDIDYSADNRNTRLVLLSPSGHPVVLCGDGVYRGRGSPGRVPGGRFCDGTGGSGPRGFASTFDDQGAQDDRPELPLARLAGESALGTWRLLVGVSAPSCARFGVIQRVTLSISGDRSTEDYLVVRGWTPNNRLGEPWLRLSGGGVEENELFLSATLYGVGPNGRREGGRGDDVARPTTFTWSWGDWNRTPPTDATVSPDGHVVSGRATGSGTLLLNGGAYEVPIHVVPPSWVRDSRLY